MEDEAIVLGHPYPWLKLFSFPAQVILADNLKLAEQRQMEESQPIRSLDLQGE